MDDEAWLEALFNHSVLVYCLLQVIGQSQPQKYYPSPYSVDATVNVSKSVDPMLYGHLPKTVEAMDGQDSV